MQPRKQKWARKVLFLAANPKGTPPLRIDEEQRQIKDSLRRSPHRDRFNVQTETAVTIGHIRRALLEYQPEVVHFGGHGAGTNGIVCEDETGQVKLIPTDALADLLRLTGNHIKCVVLNACFAEVQANEVVKHIDYVVGMKYSIGDDAALRFSEGFYDALFSGKTFPECFDLGVNAIDLNAIPEGSTPVIKLKAPAEPAAKPHAPRSRPRPKSGTGGATKAAPQEVGPTPPPGGTGSAFRPGRGRALWTVLLATLLTVAVMTGPRAWTSTPAYQPLAGSYTQETYDEAWEDPETGFRVESVHSLISISADPATGKLSMVEVTTNQIRYMPLQKRLVTCYTTEWRFKEVERASPTVVTLIGEPKERYAFNEFDLRGLMTEDVARKYEEFKKKLNRNYISGRARLHLTDEGRLQKAVKYNGGVPKPEKIQHFIRNN
jgi:hypothetical protein